MYLGLYGDTWVGPGSSVSFLRCVYEGTCYEVSTISFLCSLSLEFLSHRDEHGEHLTPDYVRRATFRTFVLPNFTRARSCRRTDYC